MMHGLEIFWYIVVAAAAIGYVVLDGFDLGAGMIHLFTKKDEERRLMLNAIGPVWDGNEVWIIIVGGALLSGFPAGYAMLCSAFYTPFMIFLAGIIFRAVALEFRSKLESTTWRKTWDVLYSLATYVITVVLGVLLGNLVSGIPINDEGIFIGTFWGFFTPYTILMGISAIALCMMHGSIYICMKTEGDFQERVKKWAISSTVFFIIAYVTLSIATITFMPHMLHRMQKWPWLYAFGLVALVCIINIPRELHKNRHGWAFLSSIFSIAFLFVLYGLGIYPHIVRSTINTMQNSVTLYNAASTKLTMTILLIMVCIGLPLVFGYGWWIYRIFRGKVKLDSTSY